MQNNNLKEIQRRAFQYFQDFSNFNKEENGYGLTPDHSKKQGIASIAATGFMLSSLVIGVEQGYIPREKAYEQAIGTLKTLYTNVSHYNGFFAHYVNVKTGIRHKLSEYSTIDTAIALCGVITIDSYFNQSELSEIAKNILDRVNWQDFIHQKKGKKLLYMAYNPDKEGAYARGQSGYIHQWDMFAEQLMMYVIIGGSKYSEHAKELYEGFDRVFGTYEDLSFIHSPGNALFIYQFPLAWFDLKNIVDADGISWFDNAALATRAHQKCSINYQETFKTMNQYYFGFTASDTPEGYRVYGALPNVENKINSDGTIAPFGIIGSLPLTPDIVLPAIARLNEIKGLWGKYGYYDAFNLENIKPWISKRYYSLDKGLELLMVNAYLSQDVYHSFMNHPIIVKGMEALQWEKIK